MFITRGKHSLVELLSILAILNRSATGRYRLAEMLGISKARVRLLLALLNQHHLIISRSGRAGTILSQKGNSLMEKMRSLILIEMDKSIIEIPELQFETANSILLIKSDSIETSGIFERDLAVRAGADGAVTLIKEDRWVIPPDKEIEMEVRGITKNHPYNMIIYTFGDESRVLAAGMTIACHHLVEEFMKILDEFLPIEQILA